MYANGKIYGALNKITNIYYLGSSILEVPVRKQTHEALSRNPNVQSDFYRAMRQYGPENFNFFLVKNFPCNSKKELEDEEYKTINEWIKDGKQLYNLKINGLHAPITKQRMSLAKMGNQNAFKCGSTFLNKKSQSTSWQFIHTRNGQIKVKSASIRKYGYLKAKHMMEDERKAVFPQFEIDEETRAIEQLMSMEMEYIPLIPPKLKRQKGKRKSKFI
jgi:hypothetical protein